MIFTTQTFIFLFFPICITAYLVFEGLEKNKRIGNFIKRIRIKDIVLILFSLLFYSWSFSKDLYFIVLIIILIYLFAKLIDKKICAKACLVTSILILVTMLGYYKYFGMIYGVFNKITNITFNVDDIIAPLGISFLTFSAISYLVDIYRGKANPGSIIDCALYMTFFPKVVSGPIVLWKEFQTQISNRSIDVETGVDGINHIIIGFAKKVLMADVFGQCVALITSNSVDQLTAIGSMVLYMLQLYYDFAGYSDIAIGLSELFGFKFKNNFNFPYRSKSISEFWRRWHISLGNWFKEYIYFPLGGSRVGLPRTLLNLFIVFLLTGIWHGAGKKYILWGVLNGLIVVIERTIRDKEFYKKIPNFVKYSFTMICVLLFWQLFRFGSVSDALNWIALSLGITQYESVFYRWNFFFDFRMIVFMIIGIMGATVFGSPKVREYYDKLISNKYCYLLQEIVLLLIFAFSICFMINSTYSPFIYFRY